MASWPRANMAMTCGRRWPDPRESADLSRGVPWARAYDAPASTFARQCAPPSPQNISDKGNGIRVGTLPDGRTIIVRPKSTDGRPTVEVRRPNGRGYEVRYGPGH